jgi:signal transduction histidine kinase
MSAQPQERRPSLRPRIARLAGLVDGRLGTEQLIGFLGSVLATLPLAVSISDIGDGWSIVYCNPLFERWVARDGEPVIGRSLLEVLPSSETSGALELLEEVARTSEARHVRGHRVTGTRDAGITTGDGATVWNWDLYPVRDAEGMVTHVLQTAVDVTAETAAGEREVADLRAQAERLEALDKVRSDFLHLATHELRSPLSVIHAYLSLLEDGRGGELTPAFRELIQPALRNVELMSDLVTELIETARLEDPTHRLRREPVDICQLAEAAVAQVEDRATAAHHLRFDGEATPPVIGDTAALLRVLTNLVDNAVKYSPHGGEVVVRVTAGSEDVRVSVRDPGLGIADTDLERLFTRFGRIVTDDTARIPGTGLGLYLCREIARRHGGDVEVETRVGEGSTFTLRLPRDYVPPEPAQS